MVKVRIILRRVDVAPVREAVAEVSYKTVVVDDLALLRELTSNHPFEVVGAEVVVDEEEE